eukprot:TRINITY_DN12851_c0_g1_i7.p1 TRINITY_DN12851_c0_g1~~TRINITY_DN12851_c0_g1_i7.p1  ORF type:complete len:128 (-),score=8.46 TRINITY_DN12851_c0_g1_i7:171-554(-)
MFTMAQKRINEVWPSVSVNGKAASGGTGCFEINVIRGGETTNVFSKLNGDGKLDAIKATAVVEKIKALVQGQRQYPREARVERKPTDIGARGRLRHNSSSHYMTGLFKSQRDQVMKSRMLSETLRLL